MCIQLAQEQLYTLIQINKIVLSFDFRAIDKASNNTVVLDIVTIYNEIPLNIN